MSFLFSRIDVSAICSFPVYFHSVHIFPNIDKLRRVVGKPLVGNMEKVQSENIPPRSSAISSLVAN